MVTLSFRLSKKKIAAAAAAVCIVAVGVFSWQEFFELIGNNPPMIMVDKKTSLKGEKEEQRQQFISSFGWTVEQEPSEIAEVLIPDEFDEVYQNYSQMQKDQGFNLEKFKGKRCKRYTYAVTNYPGKQTGVRLNLLVYKGRIIGGDLCSLDGNGFIHGFTPAGDNS